MLFPNTPWSVNELWLGVMYTFLEVMTTYKQVISASKHLRLGFMWHDYGNLIVHQLSIIMQEKPDISLLSPSAVSWDVIALTTKLYHYNSLLLRHQHMQHVHTHQVSKTFIHVTHDTSKYVLLAWQFCCMNPSTNNVHPMICYMVDTCSYVTCWILCVLVPLLNHGIHHQSQSLWALVNIFFWLEKCCLSCCLVYSLYIRLVLGMPLGYKCLNIAITNVWVYHTSLHEQ